MSRNRPERSGSSTLKWLQTPSARPWCAAARRARARSSRRRSTAAESKSRLSRVVVIVGSRANTSTLHVASRRPCRRPFATVCRPNPREPGKRLSRLFVIGRITATPRAVDRRDHSNKHSWESYEVRQDPVRFRRPRRASLGAQAQVTGLSAVAPGPSCSCPPRRPARGDALHPHRLGERVDRRRQHPERGQPFADIPAGAIAGGNFLSAGPTTTEPSTVTFSGGIDYISFLWGSPDTYNA